MIAIGADVAKTLTVTGPTDPTKTWVYVRQGVVLLEKTGAQLTISDGSISFTLSRFETARLTHREPVRFQVRWQDSNGEVHVSSLDDEEVQEYIGPAVDPIPIGGGGNG
jgi:hypothetical protein